MNIGEQKSQQVVNSFNKGIENNELMKSYGYSDDEINAMIILNDETAEGLIKGKLNTSHLVLKDVMVNGKMVNMGVDTFIAFIREQYGECAFSYGPSRTTMKECQHSKK
jgi:hypothetical protein